MTNIESVYAHVVNGKVVNISMWDGLQDYDPGAGVELVLLSFTEDEYGNRVYESNIGWSYVDGEWIAPPEPEVVEPEVA